MKKIAIYLIMILFLGISCSEDVKVNPELAGPLYGLTKGEPGSVDELIYNTWEEWECIICINLSRMLFK